MKNLKNILGLSFSGLGILSIFMSASKSITGNAIADNYFSTNLSFLIGIVFIIGGGLIIFIREDLEERVGIPRIKEDSIRIKISNKALERSEKDSMVRENTSKYISEIQKIADYLKSNPYKTPNTEPIGEFKVSPQRGTQLRVAWNYDQKSSTLYIQDLLYHTDQKRYVDKWADRARKGKIKRKDYEDKGYVDASSFMHAA